MEQTWIWLIVGLALCAAELLTGTFVILFFGIGALVAAAASFAGVAQTSLQLVIFGVAALGLILIFKKRILQRSTREEKAKALSEDIGTEIFLSDAIPAGSEASISYQGSHWTAVNSDSVDLPKGSKAVIVRTEGIKIFVKKAN